LTDDSNIPAIFPGLVALKSRFEQPHR